MSTFPVRSPFPKSVPSTRCAPAISPSSAVATAVPRSLCGWTERMAASRRVQVRADHSRRSAYPFGGQRSTVGGGLRMIGASRAGGEAALDLREAELEQQREEPALAVRVHGVDERLVAVAQVGRAPDRR